MTKTSCFLALALLLCFTGSLFQSVKAQGTSEQLICLSDDNLLSWFNVSTVIPPDPATDSHLLTFLEATGVRSDFIEISDRSPPISRGGSTSRNRTIYGFTTSGGVYQINLLTGATNLVVQVTGRNSWDALSTGFDIDHITGTIVISRRDRLVIVPTVGPSVISQTQRISYEDDDEVVTDPDTPKIVALAFAPGIGFRGPSVLYAIDAANDALSIIFIRRTRSGFSATLRGVAILDDSLDLDNSYVSLDILNRPPRLGRPVNRTSPFAILSVGARRRATVNFYQIDLFTGETAPIAATIASLYRRLRLPVLSCTFFQPAFSLVGGGSSSFTSGTETTETSQTSQTSTKATSQTSTGTKTTTNGKTSSGTKVTTGQTSQTSQTSKTSGGTKTSAIKTSAPTTDGTTGTGDTTAGTTGETTTGTPA